ncbi:DUF6621 family protein [Bacteroides helcogenes]|uniref:L-selectin n=1 Tax=Bacteroides helcogenes (strain ATCC 35417 / DSM 20613 / JCM 6297 / CCUG 15421 / P 36-108) TaxID=693979 RepID=E6SN34_BACT6|nr:DUF6621 family protein [Bacteroides helcogenes]ADV43703.1 hypothetical protein Bache_1703 [Bacteroides helcogenes P 36-108]MDY5239424.1 DUF6621 family protein [Bacteroides helcogenes]
MEDKVRFSENVILIDVAFLNEMACSVKEFLGMKLGRELQNIDLPVWLSYLSLDAGLREDTNEIQVLLLHGEDTHALQCCVPSDLDSLNGMACRTPLGEFAFSCVNAAGITTSEEMYLDLLNLTLDAADVKHLMLVPAHSVYGNRVEDALRKYFEGKSEEERGKAVYFAMEEPLQPIFARWDFVLYSLAQAFGIKSDEL